MQIPDPDEVSEVVLTWVKSVTQSWRTAGQADKAVLLVNDEDVIRLITLIRIGINAKKRRVEAPVP